MFKIFYGRDVFREKYSLMVENKYVESESVFKIVMKFE